MSSSHNTSNQLELPFTVTIPLTKDYVTIVDACDGDLIAFKWRAQGVAIKYATRSVTVIGGKPGQQKVQWMHRVILSRILGRELTRHEVVDHIDGDGLNNRRSNLRLATQMQNASNRKLNKNNTSGYKGVSWDTKTDKWVAQIMTNQKQNRLGYFDNPEDAYKAYCAAALELHGEFARLK